MDDVEESTLVFELDPVIREVMEYFAKNISLKIKLVKMLRDGEVQEEIFERLFESYSALGERLSKNRDDMIQRISFNLESMDNALKQAKIGLDELEIRKKIGDVSEAEYNVKTPAFEWDIEQYKDKVSQKKGEKAFLESLISVMSTEEIAELKAIGESCLEDIDSFKESRKINAEMASKIKTTLEDALTSLSSS